MMIYNFNLQIQLVNATFWGFIKV